MSPRTVASNCRMTESDLTHGGNVDRLIAAYPDAPRPWLDVSTGINPWPYPVPALAPEVFARLPTVTDYRRCRNAIAGAIGCPETACVPIPGSEWLIRALPRLLVTDPAWSTVVLTHPSYADHEWAWRRAGARVRVQDDPLAIADEVRAVVVCNPNNPDGRVWTVEQLEAVRARVAWHGGWLIIDEAFADLTPTYSCAGFAGRAGLIILRSFGKFFGLPGVRLGAVLASPAVRERIEAALGYWSVSGPALALGALAYQDRDWITATRVHLAQRCTELHRVCMSVGLEVRGGTDLYTYVRVPGDGLAAHHLWHALCQRGVYCRRFRDPTDHLRIGLPADDRGRDRLRAALSDGLDASSRAF